MKPKFGEIRDNFKKYAETWDESYVEGYTLKSLREAKVFYTNPAHQAETWFNALSERVERLDQAQALQRESRWQTVTIAISVVALLVSVPISIKSCHDASHALEFAEETFNETQKPELVLRPANNDGKEGFVRYIAYDDSFDIIVFIRIQNIGMRPAVNIVCPFSSMTIDIRGRKFSSEVKDIRNPISLSSQQHYFRKEKFTIHIHGTSPKAVVRELSEKNTTVRWKIEVKYTDEVTLKEYIVLAEYNIGQVNFDIIQYDHPTLVSR